MHKSFFKKSPTISGINVTPIIDVALVLVIILLITTPVMTVSDLGVNLPEAHTRNVEGDNRISITMAESGEISLDRQLVSPQDLPQSLKTILSEGDPSELLVVVRADGNVTHEAVRGVLDTARQAGAMRLAVATTMLRKEGAWKP